MLNFGGAREAVSAAAEASFFILFSRPYRFCFVPSGTTRNPRGLRARPTGLFPACYFGEHLKVCRRALFEITRLLTHADTCEADHADGVRGNGGSQQHRGGSGSWSFRLFGPGTRTSLAARCRASPRGRQVLGDLPLRPSELHTPTDLAPGSPIPHPQPIPPPSTPHNGAMRLLNPNDRAHVWRRWINVHLMCRLFIV